MRYTKPCPTTISFVSFLLAAGCLCIFVVFPQRRLRKVRTCPNALLAPRSSLRAIRRSYTMASKRPGFSRADTDSVGIALAEFRTETSSSGDHAGQGTQSDAKHGDIKGAATVHTSSADSNEEIAQGESKIISTAEDLVTQIITVEDDPSISPWTFRMFFL